MRPGVVSVTTTDQGEAGGKDLATQPRPIEEILLTYSMSHAKLPQKELEALWQFVVGDGFDSWSFHVGDPSSLFLDGVFDPIGFRAQFHVLWGVASEREGYNKKHWTLLLQQLLLLGFEL